MISQRDEEFLQTVKERLNAFWNEPSMYNEKRLLLMVTDLMEERDALREELRKLK